MTRLRMFYRMLGIAENVIEPSFYHLLGIDRKDCDFESVRSALLARKNELRQNAPGREFVPQIIEFEKEYLEPAAKVLADEVKRAKYDKVLAKRWHQIKHETEKRARLVGAVRLAVTNAIDAQGTLNASGKESLGKELKTLGVEEHNIDAILAKIPAPLFETGEHDAINAEFFNDSVGLAADGGALDENDKTKLMALADRLNIDKDQAGAAIDGASTKDEFLIQEKYLDDGEASQAPENSDAAGSGDQEGDARKIHLVNDVLYDEEKVEEVDEAVKESEAAYEAMQKRWQTEDGSSGNAFKYIAIVIGLMVLGGLAYFLINRGGGDEEKVEPGGVRNGQAKPVEPDSVTGRGQVDPVDPGIDDPGDGHGPDGTNDPADGSANGEVRQVSGQLSDSAKMLVVKDFTTLPVEELLCDTVVAMAASCSRASLLAWQSRLWNAELTEMLAGSNCADVIAARVVFADGDAEADVEAGLDDEVYEQLVNDMSSTDKHVRYFAIERLGNIGSRRAVELLLGKPVSGLSGGKQMISRRLRALRQINKPYIAGKLAGRIGVSSRGSTAHYICLALIDMTGITPGRGGVLAAKNDMSQREICAAWWENALKDWKSNETPSVEPVVDEKLTGQVSRYGKLVAAAAYYCKATAGELAVIGSGIASGSERQRPAPEPMGEIRADWDSEFVLVEAAANLNVHLEKALNKLDRDEKFSEEIAIIKSAGRQSRFAAKTGFGKAAATLETSGQLLEVLAGIYYPDGRFDTEIQKIGSDRDADIKRVENVLQEIRQHAMYNLRLFDLVLQEIDSAANSDEVYSTEILTAVSFGVDGFVQGEDELKLRKEKRLAFGELAVGLEAYLGGRMYIAGKHLAKSLEYGDGKYVRGVFHSEYSGLLDEVIADCNSGAELVCKVCGGTGDVDCSHCSGIGWDLCRECRGTGMLESARGRGAVCTTCGGLAALKCKKCEGTGVIECPEKGELASGHGEKSSSAPDRDDVKRALAIALYLKKGGADVYSKGALE